MPTSRCVVALSLLLGANVAAHPPGCAQRRPSAALTLATTPCRTLLQLSPQRAAAASAARRLIALRGGMLGSQMFARTVASTIQVAWRMLRLQLLVLALATVWPIPFVLFIYWLMHVWFGAEGTSMIAFTGIR